MEQVTSRPRHVVWNTAVTRPDEQFSYYREAICQAFMNLTPESATTSRFPAKVETIGLGAGAINRVMFPEHTVNRSRADIAASTESCFYLNFKLAGRCRMLQGDSEVSLSRGQVGIVDSDREVTLLHDRGPMLGVASFWVPSRALRDRLPPSFDFRAERVSDDPHVGHLIVETARSLNAGALRMAEEDSIRLFDVLLDLVALSLYAPLAGADGGSRKLCRRDRAGAAPRHSRAAARAGTDGRGGRRLRRHQRALCPQAVRTLRHDIFGLRDRSPPRGRGGRPEGSGIGRPRDRRYRLRLGVLRSLPLRAALQAALRLPPTRLACAMNRATATSRSAAS
ncbi:hypothetical protein ACVWZ3_009312 [Bradyrhizobium sp. i1.3.6]